MFQDSNPLIEFRGPLGVPVQVGASLLMLVLFYVILAGGDFVTAVGFVILLVLAIFLHEMGHAWASEIQGVPVRRVMLYGGGGFCEYKRSPNAHQQEFIVAMGPIVNLALWAICSLAAEYLWATFQQQALDYSNPAPALGGPVFAIAYWLDRFAQINIFLALFNLIPVQPLDGGKLLHLILLRLMTPLSAMRIAGGIGLVLSVLWIPAMFLAYGLGFWILLFIPSIPYHLAMMKGRLT